MVSWVPIASHVMEKKDITIERYHSIADTIAKASMEEPPLFKGKDAEVRTALVLASIASSESFFIANIDNCKISGDKGKAWGLWQTHAPKAKVCESREAAIKIAIDMVRTSFTQCASYNLLDRLSIYTDGECHRDWKRSNLKCREQLII